MVDDTTDNGDSAGTGRPLHYRRAPDVFVTTGQDGAKGRFFLRAPGGEVFTFGEEEHFLWNSIDGLTSVAEVQQAFATQFGVVLGVRDLLEFIAQAVRGGLIERVDDTGGDIRYDLDFADASGEPAARVPGEQTARQQHGGDRFAIFRNEPWTIIVGDPTRLFAVLGTVFGPLRYVKWLCVPAAFFACMIILKHWSMYQADYKALVRSIPFWPCMYLYEHVINILARTIEGTIIQAQGGVVRHFGLRFFMGVLMRAFIDERGAGMIPESARLWSKGGALMLRLSLFDIGMFGWIACHPGHPTLALICLFIAEIALLTFFINMCPLLTGEGYELLASYLNQKKLVGRAFRLVGIRLGGRELPATMSATERIGLVLFAIGTSLFTGMILVKILLDMGNFVTTKMHALGYLLMIFVFGAVICYFFLLVRFQKKVSATLRAMMAENRGRGPANPQPGE